MKSVCVCCGLKVTRTKDPAVGPGRAVDRRAARPASVEPLEGARRRDGVKPGQIKSGGGGGVRQPPVAAVKNGAEKRRSGQKQRRVVIRRSGQNRHRTVKRRSGPKQAPSGERSRRPAKRLGCAEEEKALAKCKRFHDVCKLIY